MWTPPGLEGTPEHGILGPQPTEVLPAAEQVESAVNFSRERERLLTRIDHAAAIRRLRRTVGIDACLWVSVLSLDWYVTQVAHEGNLAVFVAARGFGALVLALLWWRLQRAPETSPWGLIAMDVIGFGTPRPASGSRPCPTAA